MFASLVTLPLRLLGVLLGSLLLSILIEYAGMHLFWPEQGWRHAQGMLDYEPVSYTHLDVYKRQRQCNLHHNASPV